MGSIDSRVPPTPDTTSLLRRRHEWLEQRDLAHAADLIGTAFGMGLGDQARDAAEFVLEWEAAAPAALVALAGKVVHGDSPLSDAPIDIDHVQRHVRIGKLKRHIRDWPTDAIAYIDLAREYTILGQRPQALRPINIALSLAPHNRFVVRSAARYFLNCGDPEQAMAVVRRTPRVSRDPWLLAAEVAISSAWQTASRHIKSARSMVDRRGLAPKEISELAGALGTLETEAGNRRWARRLFTTALEDPTENTLAQAEWVSTEIQDLGLGIHEKAIDRSYEASALISLGEGQWETALQHARLWHLDEPFAARSAYFGSWTASVVAEDFSSALQFADFGLATKPDDLLLLNNKAVALALLNRAAEAVKYLDKIDASKAAERSEATYLATRGLVDFRLGQPESGRALYKEARETAKRGKNAREEVWTLLFQAREEKRFDGATSQRLLTSAAREIPRLRARERLVAERLLEIVAAPSNAANGLGTGPSTSSPSLEVELDAPTEE